MRWDSPNPSYIKVYTSYNCSQYSASISTQIACDARRESYNQMFGRSIVEEIGTPPFQDCSSIMADAKNAGVSAPSGVYEVGLRSGFANVTLRVWCDMDTRCKILLVLL